MPAQHLLALRLRFWHHVAHPHLRHHSAQTHGRTTSATILGAVRTSYTILIASTHRSSYSARISENESGSLFHGCKLPALPHLVYASPASSSLKQVAGTRQRGEQLSS